MVYQQPDDKKTKQFWSKISELREHKRKAEWINNIEKWLQGLKKGPKSKIFLDSQRPTLKKVTYWNSSTKKAYTYGTEQDKEAENQNTARSSISSNSV